MTDFDVCGLARLRQMTQSGEARRTRIRAGVSQSEMARALGATRAAVSSWESGRRHPRPAVAMRYAAVLENLRRLVDSPGTVTS